MLGELKFNVTDGWLLSERTYKRHIRSSPCDPKAGSLHVTAADIIHHGNIPLISDPSNIMRDRAIYMWLLNRETGTV